IIIQANAVSGAKAVGNYISPRSVGTYTEQRSMVRYDRRQGMAGRLRVIEVSCRVRLQAHREFVKVFGDLMIVIEAFNEISFAIAVEIAKPHQLVTASDEKLIAAKFYAQRLEQSARQPTPAQRRWCRRHNA